jgi:ATP-dependent Clp protease ATP-binding subunit ClpA
MFERYPPSSVRALFIARNTAGAAGSQAIEVAPSASLFKMIVLQKLHLTVPDQLSASPESEIPFSPEAKRLLPLAMSQADRLGHHRIRPEHLLLAVLAESESSTSSVLREVGLERQALIQGAADDASRDDSPLRHQGQWSVSVVRHDEPA